MGGPLSYISHQVASIALTCPMGLCPGAGGFGSAALRPRPCHGCTTVKDVIGRNVAVIFLAAGNPDDATVVAVWT